MRAARLWMVIRASIAFVFLYAVWLLFTGSAEPFSLVSGAVGSLAIAILTYSLFLADHDVALGLFMPKPHTLLVYLWVLTVNLYASSWRMLKAVLSGGDSPRIVYFRTRLKGDLARMVLANSITLTPGTITLDLDEDHLTVHWFFASTSHSRAAGDEIKGSLEKWLSRVWT